MVISISCQFVHPMNLKIGLRIFSPKTATFLSGPSMTLRTRSSIELAYCWSQSHWRYDSAPRRRSHVLRAHPPEQISHPGLFPLQWPAADSWSVFLKSNDLDRAERSILLFLERLSLAHSVQYLPELADDTRFRKRLVPSKLSIQRCC